METITINATENQNNQQHHVVANLADDLNDDHSIDEDQIMHLRAITDLAQEDMVSIPKEIILISMVSQEQALYNPKHEYYRNTQQKDVKWTEIAEHVGWSETQCKAKWKAMRDQYCRELKRSKFNIKANVKWKYFKELDFLRPYALARNYRPRNPILHSQQSLKNNYSNNNSNAINNNNNNNNSNSNSNGNNTNVMYCCKTAVTTTTLATPTSLLTGLNVMDYNDNDKFDVTTTIKIESNNIKTFDACDFVNNSSNNNNETNQRTITNTLTGHQLHNVLEQQHQIDDSNWSYLTGSTATTTGTIHNKDNNNNNNNNSNSNSNSVSRLRHNQQHSLTTIDNAGHHLLNNSSSEQQQTTDEALYNAFVDCVGQMQQQQQQQLCEQAGITTTSASSLSNGIGNHQTTKTTTTTIVHPLTVTDEEDDDPIHTFLNIESYFEKELILLIQQEDVLYNSYHPSYRNVKVKMEIWDEIARKLKKTVKQCRLKWKALRDQFIREHKRLKYRDNVETLPRWKHYDALSFLQNFIKHKTSEFDITKSSTLSTELLHVAKVEMEMIDMDEDEDDQMNITIVNSPLNSPIENIKLESQQQQQQNERSLNETPPTTESSNIQQKQHQQQQAYTQMTTLKHHHTHNQLHQHHYNQQSNHSDNMCVSSGSVEACYDDMDIDNYIIGDGDAVDTVDVCSNAANGAGDDGVGRCSSSMMDDSQSCKTETDHHPDNLDEHKAQNNFSTQLYNNNHHHMVTNNNCSPNNNNSSSNTLNKLHQTKQEQQQQKQQQQQQRISAVLDNEMLRNTSERLQKQCSQKQQQQQQQHMTLNSINLNDNVVVVPSTFLHNENNEMQMTENQSSCQINNTKTMTTITTPISFDYSKATTTAAIASPINPINCLANHLNAQILSLSKFHKDTTTTKAAEAVVEAVTTTSTAPTTEAYTNTTPLSSPINYNQQQQQQQQHQLNCQYQYLRNHSSIGLTATDVDDEVGAFFKAIAMKIRNAKMSPLAFTDLQIDILKVINCSLRNH